MSALVVACLTALVCFLTAIVIGDLTALVGFLTAIVGFLTAIVIGDLTALVGFLTATVIGDLTALAIGRLTAGLRTLGDGVSTTSKLALESFSTRELLLSSFTRFELLTSPTSFSAASIICTHITYVSNVLHRNENYRYQ